MGLADIVVEALESEQVRNVVGEAGVRVFNTSFQTQQQPETAGEVIAWLWDGAKALYGWITQDLGAAINFTITSFGAHCILQRSLSGISIGI